MNTCACGPSYPTRGLGPGQRKSRPLPVNRGRGAGIGSNGYPHENLNHVQETTGATTAGRDSHLIGLHPYGLLPQSQLLEANRIAKIEPIFQKFPLQQLDLEFPRLHPIANG